MGGLVSSTVRALGRPEDEEAEEEGEEEEEDEEEDTPADEVEDDGLGDAEELVAVVDDVGRVA